MTNVNLFKANLTGKNLIQEKAASRKAVHKSLQDYAFAIDGAFTAVIKSSDIKARNVANAAKGKYHTAIEVVGNCYPYQTAQGVLCTKRTTDDGRKVWAEKKLTAAAARGIVRLALDNFIKGVGVPEVLAVIIGTEVPEVKKAAPVAEAEAKKASHGNGRRKGNK